MDERFHDSRLLPADVIRALSERRDGPGLALAAAQGALSLAALVLLVRTATTPAWALGAVPAGLLLATWFGAFHEALHRTAFRSRALNGVLVWVAGFLCLSSPTNYRAFHYAHHRHTHEPGQDPELALLSPDWPRSVVGWVFNLSGLQFLLAKIAALVGLCLWAPASVWDKQAPWLPARDRVRVGWESRLVAAGWAGVLYAAHGAGALASVAVAFLVAHVALAAVLTAEHAGLAQAGPVIARTRTTETLGIVRRLFWGLPRHAEHHAWPSIPFFRLDEVHDRVRSELPNVRQGYVSTHLEVLRGILGR